MIRISSLTATAGSSSGPTARDCRRTPGRLNRVAGPLKTSADINGHARAVLRFDGEALLELPRKVPATGSLFVVFRPADTGSASQRLLGWEDSDAGKHGLGLMPDPKGRLHAILRNDGRSGDLVDARPPAGFELVCVTWGPRGTTLHRNGAAAGSQKGVDAVSSDPSVAALRLGGPGSGGSPRFRGDLAEVRVYDRQLDDTERRLVEAELRATWFDPTRSEDAAERPADRAVRRIAVRPWPVLARRGRAESDAPRRRSARGWTASAGSWTP